MTEMPWDALLNRADRLLDRLEGLLPGPLVAPDWASAVAWRYRRRSGAAWSAPVLEPVRHVGRITLDDLREVDSQKERYVRNLEQFVAARPANNVLLSGARGTGKSSLVRAGLNDYAARGLRLIEIDKGDLIDLPDLVSLVECRRERFLVFCDDLSFEEGEPGYKALKSVLDGSVAAAGENVLIVATSNRRHLLPEYHHENQTYRHTEDGEVHPGEVVEEKISLSERFGLWISFHPFSQEEYLAIVGQWLRASGMNEDEIAASRAEALVWALERGSRSGRVAYQYARDRIGRQA